MLNVRFKIKSVIFGTETTAGKLFDLILILLILMSVSVVLLESISDFYSKHWIILNFLELIFTIFFTLEYLLRIYCVNRKLRYIFSFYGIIDFLAIIPTYLSYFLPFTNLFSIIRVLIVLRVFRILKLVQYIGESELLINALIASRRKIFVFLFGVFNLIIILGSIMYIVEGQTPGFTSIPKSIYWAIVTLTTVGYGDITPSTNLGQGIAAFIMLIGYCIIAVPTGIVSAEMTSSTNSNPKKNCNICGKRGLEFDATYCSKCGVELL